jgi:hypothetical protein
LGQKRAFAGTGELQFLQFIVQYASSQKEGGCWVYHPTPRLFEKMLSYQSYDLIVAQQKAD